MIYIFRAAIQLIQSHKARSWPTVQAKVITATDGFEGCPTAEVTYKYRVDGELYTASHTEPFLFGSSQKCFLAQCDPDNEILVRVKPRQPGSSVLRERDVYFQTHGYRLDS